MIVFLVQEDISGRGDHQVISIGASDVIARRLAQEDADRFSQAAAPLEWGKMTQRGTQTTTDNHYLIEPMRVIEG